MCCCPRAVASARPSCSAHLAGQGDKKVYHWYYDDPSLNHLGCGWHPSRHDDQVISGLINTFIGTLPLTW